MPVKRSHIVVITAAWKRPELFALWCANMHSLRPRPQVVCVGSPGDQCEWIARLYGHKYEQVSNADVCLKWNHALTMARRTKGQQFMFMGSDDFMDQACWGYYSRFRGPYLAMLDYYFHHLETNVTLYWNGYQDHRHGHPIGAAQMVRRDAMERAGWELFRPGRYFATDFDMRAKLLKVGVKAKLIRMEDTGGFSMDVKTGVNQTPWKVIEGITHMRHRYLDELSPQLWNLFGQRA